MAYNESLLDRVRESMAELPDVEEKKMFQGICFLVDQKMCVCIRNDELLCRIGEQQAEKELEQDNCRQMINNGRVMKDFVYVEGVNTKQGLDYWIDLSLQFNKEAKPAKKRKKTK